MANPGLLLKGAKMLSKTPAGKKAKKKVAENLTRVVDVVSRKGLRNEASIKKMYPPQTRKAFEANIKKMNLEMYKPSRQQASTNNLMRDGMTKKMDAAKSYIKKIFKIGK